MKGIKVSDLRDAKPGKAVGSFVEFAGERFYKIENYDAMPAFFMTIVSSSDVWNYIWSNGGLSAGRVDSDHAVFPYYTADKVSDDRTYTGPYTAIRVRAATGEWLWEPFAEGTEGIWDRRRALYKNASGTKVYFEETNRDLALTFRYGWTSSDRFGLVRHAEIVNLAAESREVELLDGCRNVLPACVTSAFQNDNSVLLDAYKRTDLIPGADVATFSVTSIVTDKPEPNEGLLANVSWFSRPGTPVVEPDAVDAFRRGEALPLTAVTKGRRGAFFLARDLALAPAGSAGDREEWYQVFDNSLDHARLAELARLLADRAGAERALVADVELGRARLEAYLADADGMQQTADGATCAHHEANVLFNVMRGGIPADGYRLEKSDFVAFARARNRPLAATLDRALSSLGDITDCAALRQAVESSGNPQLIRLAREYLPLTFSRRHGDPSRPWNRFSIELKDAAGKRRLNYQGNWRDIFQNWEALALSWPGYLDNMSAKFLNATTGDGFNPYRVSREGIDWEVQEPDNPWSNIGYWGDHQVIYLAKLLELRAKFDRAGLVSDLGRECFSTGNVPYRLKPYADIARNPRSTIVFDAALHAEIMRAERDFGSDARLLRTGTGEVDLVSMTAKLLQIVLAKMANLVPGGGIWLNTQRPEWNDANNALAGYGLSVVTLCYLRRFMVFLSELYKTEPNRTFAVPAETARFFSELVELYGSTDPTALADSAARRAFVDRAGTAFERQRESLYADGYSPKRDELSGLDVARGLSSFIAHAEATIERNRRTDGLFHSYNTLSIADDGGMEIHHLDEMLEGQVAVLSSGYLSGTECVALCRALKSGRLFRPDQYSYILYPDKELPRFADKNALDAGEARSIPLLARMIERGDESLVRVGPDGIAHFNPAFRNGRCLDDALAAVRANGSYDGASIDADARAIRALYEKTFHHQSFTGRSGTFYAYEGLGSIYWHMVAKLMLAVQENCLAEKNEPTRRELELIYYDVRKGIGFNKTPAEYGAFPTDPYSHTPAGQGAKQPGMTGQVKEEILARWGELGISISDGRVAINPTILRASEFREDGTLAFTWCGTPFVYRLAATNESTSITVHSAAGAVTREGGSLTAAESAEIFARSGAIRKVEATVCASEGSMA